MKQLDELEQEIQNKYPKISFEDVIKVRYGKKIIGNIVSFEDGYRYEAKAFSGVICGKKYRTIVEVKKTLLEE